jgi:hypothetical protein
VDSIFPIRRSVDEHIDTIEDIGFLLRENNGRS